MLGELGGLLAVILCCFEIKWFSLDFRIEVTKKTIRKHKRIASPCRLCSYLCPSHPRCWGSPPGLWGHCSTLTPGRCHCSAPSNDTALWRAKDGETSVWAHWRYFKIKIVMKTLTQCSSVTLPNFPGKEERQTLYLLLIFFETYILMSMKLINCKPIKLAIHSKMTLVSFSSKIIWTLFM